MPGLNAVPKPRMQAKAKPKFLPKVNVKRAAIRRARDFGSIAEWLVTLPCCVCGKKTGEWTNVGTWSLLGVPSVTQVLVIPSHVKSRGSGGRKYANQIPLAAHLEDRQHAHGWESIGLTKEKAKQLATEYEALYRSLFATSDETGNG